MTWVSDYDRLITAAFTSRHTHAYLSTSCLHGRHVYCQAATGSQGPKTPSRCKFCTAPCLCPCHEEDQP
ncbi:MAG: hypothetical protein ACRDP6_47365 [Actinoallomurus sp.]